MTSKIYNQQMQLDALPLIDTQYDQPAVKHAVETLIAAEMRSFTPHDYLQHLPYPQLRFARSTALQAEFGRVSSGKLEMSKIETKRYSVPAPEEALAEDQQAWKASINNAKAQVMHQSNRIMNAEVQQELTAPLWLQQNAALKSLVESYESKEKAAKREIFQLNCGRVRLQEQINPELQSLLKRRNEALQKTLQYRLLYSQLGGQLQQEAINNSNNSNSNRSNWCDPEALLQQRREQRISNSAVVDANDPQYNSTVRQYETINVTTAAEDDDNDDDVVVGKEAVAEEDDSLQHSRKRMRSDE